MSKQMILGTVLDGIVLFVWGAIAWMFIPWPGQPLRAFKNEDAMTQAIIANAAQSGNFMAKTATRTARKKSIYGVHPGVLTEWCYKISRS